VHADVQRRMAALPPDSALLDLRVISRQMPYYVYAVISALAHAQHDCCCAEATAFAWTCSRGWTCCSCFLNVYVAAGSS
jgi:hypothetical protein